MKTYFAIVTLVLALLTIQSAHAGDIEAVGDIKAEMGKEYPSGPLADWVGMGNQYRFSFFGGAKTSKIKWLSGVGLGLDFTYSDHQSRSGEPGFAYRKYMWDWFFLPVNLFTFFELTPGIAWIVTDVKSPSLGLDKTSIRPAGVFTLGFRFPIMSHVCLRADGRIEKAFADHEKTSQGTNLNLTGTFYSWMGGLEILF